MTFPHADYCLLATGYFLLRFTLYVLSHLFESLAQLL